MAEYYSDETIRRVRDTADIRRCIPGADTNKPTSYVPCPKCGKAGKGKGLCVTHTSRKNIAKCFHCDFTLSDGVAATMFYECNEDPKRYIEAVKKTADANGLVLVADKRETKITSRQKSTSKSFVERQLEASGLTFDDVMVRSKEVVKGETLERYEPAMRRGSIDRSGLVHPGDDEMLI